MDVKLRVPLIGQESRKSCWYASACMVQAYHGHQNLKRKGWAADSPLWAARDEKYYAALGEDAAAHPAPRGIRLGEFALLAGKAGLTKIRANPPWTSDMVGTYLRNYGPLWCAGHWRRSGHVIVLTGVEGDTLFFNDPAGGGQRIDYPLSKFNQRVDVVMYHKV